MKAKNRLFNPGQNFCPGQFEYCPGQKIFCRADGRGITIRNIDKACDTAPPCSYGPVIETERLIGRLGLRKITLVA